MFRSDPEIVVVGAGPAGLAVAIAAARRGLSYEVVEKGALVNSILHFPANMTFFTTPELLEIGGLPFVTPYEKPTRREALRYYRRVADTFDLRISFDEEVRDVARSGEDSSGTGFQVSSRLKTGGERVRRARAVVLATGYYDHPNLLGIPGEDLPHVTHYYDEPHSFFRKQVLVVGGKNSAAVAALELYRSGAHVTLVHRRERLGDAIKYWIRPDIENRIREGSIDARFETQLVEIRERSAVLQSGARREEVPADAVFLLTGYHPDTGLLRRAGIRVDEKTLVPEHDPETFETNVPGLYVAGAIVSGMMTNRIFIENGRFHGEAIVASLESR